MREVKPAFPYMTLAQQNEAAQLGIWIFIGTEVLFFGALILGYMVYRYGFADDFAAAARHTKIAIGTANTAILLTSSFFVAWAVTAAKDDSGRLAAMLLATAALLGALFLGLKGYEYALEFREHLFPGGAFTFDVNHARGARLFFLFYFGATALHGVHAAMGIVILAITAGRARRGTYSARYHAPITVAALYWHFVDLVWIFLFALIYLPGRSGG